jgi:hypothetical protein
MLWESAMGSCSVDGTMEWGVEGMEGAGVDTRLELARPRKVESAIVRAHTSLIGLALQHVQHCSLLLLYTSPVVALWCTAHF